MAPRTSQREILNLTGFISKERFARFSENPDKFRDDFLRLGLAFSLTCLIIVILAHGCTRDEKESILTKAREPMASWPPIHTPNSSGRWGCNPRTWLTGTRGLCKARLGWDITYLSKGMKRHMVKPVNYDEVWEVTQEEGENPPGSLPQLGERGIQDLHQYRPRVYQGRTLLARHFTTELLQVSGENCRSLRLGSNPIVSLDRGGLQSL